MNVENKEEIVENEAKKAKKDERRRKRYGCD